MKNCENLKLSQTQEVWIQITDEVVPNIKPYYYISNWGRVASISGGIFQFMSPSYDEDGYLQVLLRIYPILINENFVRKRVTVKVHRLVLMSFYPIPKNYQELDLEINHINCIRDDNHLWNLEWMTSKENVHHAMIYGKLKDFKGETHPSAKLTNEDVYKIVELGKTGLYTYKDLAKMFNVSARTVRLIFIGKTWTNLNLNITENELEYFRNAAFSDNEVNQICEFFERTDINNKQLYPNPIDLLKDCFYTLELDKKYNFKSKKNTLFRILTKSVQNYDKIMSKYNYKFIR